MLREMKKTLGSDVTWKYFLIPVRKEITRSTTRRTETSRLKKIEKERIQIK